MRTEPTTISLRRREVRVTVLAPSQHCAFADSAGPYNEYLSRLQCEPVAQPDVAEMTGRHEVGGCVVTLVAVKMIGDERPGSSGPSPSASLPCNRLAAMVAGVRARPDLRVQHQTMLADVAVASSKRMVWTIKIAIGQEEALY